MNSQNNDVIFGAILIAMATAIPIKFAVAARAGFLPDAPSSACIIDASLIITGLALQFRSLHEAATVARALALLVLGMVFTQDAMFASISLGSRLVYADQLLSSWDHSLGFDWPRYTAIFDHSQWLWVASKIVYAAMFPQIPLAIFVLSYAGLPTRLYVYLAALCLSLFVCIIIVGFFPALGAYAHAGGTRGGFIHKDFEVGDCMTTTLERLRHGIAIGANPELGLISFPSFHAVGAVLGSWAFWQIKHFRWPILALNMLMISATPVQGSHYLVDLIAGILVAIFSLVSISALVCLAENKTRKFRLPQLRSKLIAS